MTATSRADTIRAVFFDGDKVKRIDVYFDAGYENGKFFRQRP